jgi:CYTH domain-containing protein
MALEIERKFLVNGDFRSEVVEATRIVQGYLCSAPGRTVRIRTRDSKAYITIKGSAGSKGFTRYEWEKEIPLEEAEELLLLCEQTLIEKTRYLIKHGNHLFEVDEFSGENAGLIIAEVELKSEDEYFEKPAWLGKEVTGDIRYYNSYLSGNPYSRWKC